MTQEDILMLCCIETQQYDTIVTSFCYRSASIRLNDKIMVDGRVLRMCVVLQCELCLKTFVRPCLLRSHVRLAHPADNTVEVYKCTEPGCSRTYASVRSLRRHVMLLHKGQVVECPQCQRSLSTKVSTTSLLKCTVQLDYKLNSHLLSEKT